MRAAERREDSSPGSRRRRQNQYHLVANVIARASCIPLSLGRQFIVVSIMFRQYEQSLLSWCVCVCVSGILKRLKAGGKGEFETPGQTVGFNLETITYKKREYSVWVRPTLCVCCVSVSCVLVSVCQ